MAMKKTKKNYLVRKQALLWKLEKWKEQEQKQEFAVLWQWKQPKWVYSEKETAKQELEEASLFVSFFLFFFCMLKLLRRTHEDRDVWRPGQAL